MENITISKEQYDEYIDAARLLIALYAFGIREWEHWNEAFAYHEQRKVKINNITNEKLLKYAKENPIPQSWYDEEPQRPPEN